MSVQLQGTPALFTNSRSLLILDYSFAADKSLSWKELCLETMNSAMLCSTMFLMGPLKQLSKMFDKGRIVASCLYIASLGLTLFSALKVPSTLYWVLSLVSQAQLILMNDKLLFHD